MNPIEFLKNELNKLAVTFPTVHIKYGYNNNIETHIVELLPLIEYNTNEKLDEAWIPVSIAFMETFKSDEIAFISSDSTLSLKEVIFEFNTKACTEENIMIELYQELAKSNLDYTFPKEIPQSVIFIPSTCIILKLKARDGKPFENVQDAACYSIAA